MQLRGTAGAIAVTALAGLAFALPAQAAKFCVEKPKCVQDGGTAQATVQAAFNAAGANGAGRDRVELGAKTFNGPFTAGAGNPVKLVGSGIGKTTLTRTGTTDFVTLLTLGAGASSVSDLQIVINEGAGVVGVSTPGAIKGIRVKGQSSDAGEVGASVAAGGTMSKSQVSLPQASSVGVVMQGAGATVRESKVRAATGVAGGAPGARGVRLRITATITGFLASNADVVLDQATIRMIGAAGGVGLQVNGAAGPVDLTARHVTVVGNNATNSSGAVASATGIAGPCPTSELVLRNVIVRAFDVNLTRAATNIGCAGTVRADIRPAYSVYDPGSVISNGAGQIHDGKGNRDVNPRFVKESKGNYHLRPSSPVIDRGEPGKPSGSQSRVDLDGRRRVIDGDGNGRARRDIGAFEFRP